MLASVFIVKFYHFIYTKTRKKSEPNKMNTTNELCCRFIFLIGSLVFDICHGHHGNIHLSQRLLETTFTKTNPFD